LESFLGHRLPAQQQVSPHTLASYRDALRLLLRFVDRHARRPPSQQTLSDWDAPIVLHFLDYLEDERHCQARTRNARLAAVRAFMRYVAQQQPEALAITQRVLAIPVKRCDRRLAEFLSTAEFQAVLQAANPATASGRRDQLLFNLLYHTGARISEALQLRQEDLRWGPPATVRLHGKGRKERVIPLLRDMARLLKQALALVPPSPQALVFQNRFGAPLTRWGAAKRLRQVVRQAAQHCPSLRGRAISPHTFRHTTATSLLRAGVDLTVIALILGHESPQTTHHYTELDLQMKERCLRKLGPSKNKASRFKASDRLLKWLDSL
jgi:site-specific recombinase XerD